MRTTPKSNRHLGCRPDAADKRDFVLPRQRALIPGAPLPAGVDVFAGLKLPVYDQGDLGSCTANAGVLYRRFLAQKFFHASAADEDLSRLFLYFQERALPWNNDIGHDVGASVRDACYVMANTGVCPETDDPYNTALFASLAANENARVKVDAIQYQIGAYHRVPDVDTARSCLASGYAVLLGCTVYQAIEDVTREQNVLRMPVSGERSVGGHALVIRGYNDPTRCFLVQNSWGEQWGLNGCFWMPYEYLGSESVSTPDMWIMHMGKPWK